MHPRTLERKCKTIVELQEQIKREYAVIDGLMEEVISAINKGMDVPDGYVLTDAFDSKTKAFKTVAFNRYSLTIDK